MPNAAWIYSWRGNTSRQTFSEVVASARQNISLFSFLIQVTHLDENLWHDHEIYHLVAQYRRYLDELLDEHCITKQKTYHTFSKIVGV